MLNVNLINVIRISCFLWQFKYHLLYHFLELQARLDKQREAYDEELNSLKHEIELLQIQLKDKDLEVIEREKRLSIQNGKFESDKRSYTTEKDIAIAQLEVEKQTIRVSIDNYNIFWRLLETRTQTLLTQVCCIHDLLLLM